MGAFSDCVLRGKILTMLPKIIIIASLVAVTVARSSTYPPRSGTYQPRNGESCGNFPIFMIGDRIVGGEAAASPIPWQVSVRNGQSGYGHFCGGTILDETTVMSAAHCFDKDQSMSGYHITAGVKDRFNNSGQTIEIEYGVWNTEMPYEGNNNDFIILKLKNALTFNDDVAPICLPEPDHAPDATGQTCFVSGWGTLESGANSLPTDLQWVAVPTVTNEQCSNSYNGITDSMICAGLPEGGKDSCQGDSGGPFVCKNDDDKAVLTGVVSFGIGCALADYPGVYARVTAVLDWVKASMGDITPPPNPPTTAGPTQGPSDCMVEWIGDSFCDDVNNNPECEFDGGDCCQEDAEEGWDQYCNDCLCIEIPETTEAPSECIDQWIGDNFCDDQNNNPECEMDGGDCCQEEPEAGWDQYCSDCFCIEIPETTEAPYECADQWIGDNICDDRNNNPECEMDGGDCCQDEPVAGWDQYCSDCFCIEIPETTEGPFECIDQWIGDSLCDDQNNNPECDFDGGDCCQEDAADGWDNYCQICKCFDFPETTQAPDGSNCVAPHWFGDNICDDENNNSECGYDGGDCCGNDVNTDFCSECECLE